MKQGDAIKIKSKEIGSTDAHFASYRNNNLKIAFPLEITRYFLLEKYEIYAFEFNEKSKTLSILGE